jgi:hypothetical protein
MADSLKDENKLALFGLIAANIAFYYAVVQNNAILAGNWINLAKNIGDVLPAGLGLILTGVINAQLSPETKARIVFMSWNDPLPGCKAFTHHAKSDPRVNIAALKRVCGSLPTNPKKQNALWYSLYKSVEKEPAVLQAHRAFLLTRDYTCLSLMFVIVLGIAGFIQISSMRIAFIYFGVLLIQFVLAGQAARNHGKRFVTSVLAIKAATQVGVQHE